MNAHPLEAAARTTAGASVTMTGNLLARWVNADGTPSGFGRRVAPHELFSLREHMLTDGLEARRLCPEGSERRREIDAWIARLTTNDAPPEPGTYALAGRGAIVLENETVTALAEHRRQVAWGTAKRRLKINAARPATRTPDHAAAARIRSKLAAAFRDDTSRRDAAMMARVRSKLAAAFRDT
jgi:hypothetical protein